MTGGVETYFGRVVNSNCKLPHGPRLALSNAPRSFTGLSLPTNQFHFSCETPSEIMRTAIDREAVARMAMIVFRVRPRGNSGRGLPSCVDSIITSAIKRQMPTRHHTSSTAHEVIPVTHRRCTCFLTIEEELETTLGVLKLTLGVFWPFSANIESACEFLGDETTIRGCCIVLYASSHCAAVVGARGESITAFEHEPNRMTWNDKI